MIARGDLAPQERFTCLKRPNRFREASDVIRHFRADVFTEWILGFSQFRFHHADRASPSKKLGGFVASRLFTNMLLSPFNFRCKAAMPPGRFDGPGALRSAPPGFPRDHLCRDAAHLSKHATFPVQLSLQGCHASRWVRWSRGLTHAPSRVARGSTMP